MIFLMFQSPPSRPNSDQSTLEIPIRFVPNFGCKELPSSIMFHPSSHSVTKWGGQTSGSNQPKKTTRRMIYIYINIDIDIVDLIPGCLVAELSPKRGTPGTPAQA